MTQLFIGLLWVAALVVSPALVAADQATYIYDDLGRLSQVIDGQGNVATYTYDAVGNLLSIARNAGGVGAPTITALTPNSGQAGQTVTVTITGQNLQGAAVSTDNPGIAIRNVVTTPNSVSASFAIAFTARVGATSIIVTTSIGSAVGAFTVSASPPSITSLSPTTGPPTRLVTMTGTGFSATPSLNQISVNGVPATVLRATPTQLLTQVPVGASTGPVTVTTNSFISNGVAFTVTTPSGPPPTVATITPNLGSVQGGSQLTITGNNFVAGTTVLFGAKAGTLVTIVNPTTLRVMTPAGVAGPVDVVVSNANGDAFVPTGFTYVNGAPLSILSISPTPGLINVARNVPISVNFARPVDRATVTSTTIALSAGGTPIAGVLSFEFSDTVVTFTPSAPLAASTVHTLSITQGVKSVDGVPLDGAFLGSFTTGTGSDTTGPTVTVSPANGAIGVPYNSVVVLSFSEPVNPMSINSTTIQVSNQGAVRNGALALRKEKVSGTISRMNQKGHD